MQRKGPTLRLIFQMAGFMVSVGDIDNVTEASCYCKLQGIKETIP